MIELPEAPELGEAERRRVEADFERFRDGLPPDLRAHVLEAHGLDIAGEYAGRVIRNLWDSGTDPGRPAVLAPGRGEHGITKRNAR